MSHRLIAATNTPVADALTHLGGGTLFCPKKVWSRLHLNHIPVPKTMPFPQEMLIPNGTTRIAMPTAHLDADTLISRLKGLGIEIMYSGINPACLTYLKAQRSTPTGWIVCSKKVVPMNDVTKRNLGAFEHDAMLFADGLQLLGLYALEHKKVLFEDTLYFQCIDDTRGKLCGPYGFYIHMQGPRKMMIMRQDPTGGRNPPTMTVQRLIRPS